MAFWESARAHLSSAREALRQVPKSGKPAKTSQELDFTPAFLEILERPPANVARGFVLSIMILCAITVIWTVFGRIDIIASAPGRLIVDQMSKTVQAVEQGSIRRIHVKDGQSIVEGDPLVTLNPVVAQAELKRLEDRYARAELEYSRLKALNSSDPMQSFGAPNSGDSRFQKFAAGYLSSEFQAFRAKQETFEAQLSRNRTRQETSLPVLAETREMLEKTKRIYRRRKELAAKGVFPRIQLLELEREVIRIRRTLKEQLVEQTALKAEERVLEAEADLHEAEWRQTVMRRLNEQQSEIIDLRQNLIKAREKSRLQVIRAPVNGVAQEVSVHTVGGAVTAGMKLMVIVPDNANLEAEIQILNKDKGFVSAGQIAELKIETFPYTKFGTIKGKVLHVSRDSVEDERLGAVFPARVSLDQSHIAVDRDAVALTAGMRVTAEIKTGNRRIVDYLLSPLREYQSESLKER